MIKFFRCNKTVFFAEKQSYDGKDFHGMCLTSYKKEMKSGLVGHMAGFSAYPDPKVSQPPAVNAAYPTSTPSASENTEHQ
jgi:hypothetical protein